MLLFWHRRAATVSAFLCVLCYVGEAIVTLNVVNSSNWRQSVFRADPNATRNKLVIVCNAYTDTRPAYVGLMAVRDNARDAVNAADRLRKLKSKGSEEKKPKEAVWMRAINYGTCEEYGTDVDHQRLFFLRPGNDEEECSFNPSTNSGMELSLAQGDSQKIVGRGPIVDGDFARLVVVLKQPIETSTNCIASSMTLPNERGDRGMAELVVLDAFARKVPQEQGLEDEELEMQKEDERAGLTPLPPLDTGSVIRLEDQIESYSIASEIIGTRTLTPGQVYNVEPKKMHVVLEDLRGTAALDHKDIAFEAGHTYIGIRIGRVDDKAFPQRLSFYPCHPAPMV